MMKFIVATSFFLFFSGKAKASCLPSEVLCEEFLYGPHLCVKESKPLDKASACLSKAIASDKQARFLEDSKEQMEKFESYLMEMKVKCDPDFGEEESKALCALLIGRLIQVEDALLGTEIVETSAPVIVDYEGNITIKIDSLAVISKLERDISTPKSRIGEQPAPDIIEDQRTFRPKPSLIQAENQQAVKVIETLCNHLAGNSILDEEKIPPFVEMMYRLYMQNEFDGVGPEDKQQAFCFLKEQLERRFEENLDDFSILDKLTDLIATIPKDERMDCPERK
jgi:hypothetical protein